MFRVVFFGGPEDPTTGYLDSPSYDTEASAEEAIMRALSIPDNFKSAQILRPIAELAPVTSIQRRPLMPMASGGGGDNG